MDRQISRRFGRSTGGRICPASADCIVRAVSLGPYPLEISIKKWDPLYVLILFCCPILIYKTSSRTGMGSFLLGMAFVGYLFLIARGVRRRWRQKALSVLMTILTLSLCVLVFMPAVREGAVRFALKFQGEGTKLDTENIISSRKGLIDKAIYNFKKSPLIGNGFQVSDAMKGMKMEGFALSAPIEKGVWITAVLEEGGRHRLVALCRVSCQ